MVDEDDLNSNTNEIANNDEFDSDKEDPGSPKVKPKTTEAKKVTNKGLGFWLKQLQSEEEVFKSNLSTVANIDTDESLDGNDR